jgi:uracil phosphoribosyltransferase
MLATGGSLSWAIDKVKENGARDIVACCVVVAPEGVEAIETAHPDVRVVAAALDRELNPSFYIAPAGCVCDRCG